MTYKIIDWTGKHVFKDKIFTSSNKAWDFIESLPEPEQPCYDAEQWYQVKKIKKIKVKYSLI